MVRCKHGRTVTCKHKNVCKPPPKKTTTTKRPENIIARNNGDIIFSPGVINNQSIPVYYVCKQPARACQVDNCTVGINGASRCHDCILPSESCHGKCQNEDYFCENTNKCLASETLCKKTTLHRIVSESSSEPTSPNYLYVSILVLASLIVLAGLLALVAVLRKNKQIENGPRMRKVVKKEKVEYRVTVERVQAEVNEYYGEHTTQEGQEEGSNGDEDEWNDEFEMLEENCYYGETEGGISLYSQGDHSK